MSTSSILLTIVCVGMIAGGQLLFKAGADRWHVDGWTWSTVVGFLSPVMILALFVYALATVLWVFVLRKVPLSVAYSLFSLAYVLVPLLAHVILGEPLPAKLIVGATLIVVGIVVVVR